MEWSHAALPSPAVHDPGLSARSVVIGILLMATTGIGGGDCVRGSGTEYAGGTDAPTPASEPRGGASPLTGARPERAGNRSPASGRLTISVFRRPDGRGHGYRISTREGVVITQPHVPAVQGIIGFASASAARRVANLVAERMRAGVLPPAVTPRDLDSLGVVTNTQELRRTRWKR